MRGDPRLTLDMWSHPEASEKDKPSFSSCGDPGGSGPESAMRGLALPPEEVTFSSFFLLLSSTYLEDGIWGKTEGRGSLDVFSRRR